MYEHTVSGLDFSNEEEAVLLSSLLLLLLALQE